MGTELSQRAAALVDGPALTARLCAVGVLLYLLGWLSTDAACLGPYTHADILEALRQVESSGRDAPPDGDDGRAIGPYQIHESYWRDSGVPGEYQRCRDRRYAERVVAAYMRRYVPRAWATRDAEVIARTHNGGPLGRAKSGTWRYWLRVQEELRRLR